MNKLLKILIYSAAIIGATDFLVQVMTGFEVKLVYSILELIFN